MFISRQASLPTNRLLQHSFSQDLGLDSIIGNDSKIANQSATTNSPSYEDIDSPNIFPIPDLEEQEQMRRIKQRIEALKEQKEKMNMRFKGYIQNLEGTLRTKEQLNRKLKQDIKDLKSECNETTKDIQIIRKHLKKSQPTKQIATEKQYGKYTISKHIYTETSHRRKPSNLTKISIK